MKRLPPLTLALALVVAMPVVFSPRNSAVAQTTSSSTAQDTTAPVSARDQETQLKNEEKANKERAKTEKAQRKALKRQEKANKAAKKAGTAAQATATTPASATPQ